MKQYKISAFFLFAILVIGAIGITPAHADSTNANAAEGLQISPALIELNGERGKSYTINLTLFNVTSSTLAYTATANDFVAKDETGTPKILLNDTEPASVSVQTWLNSIPSFQLKPQERRTISTTITIPNNAEAGGHYGVVRFTGTIPGLQNTGVQLSASAGALLLIRVDGTITENATIATFTAEQNGAASSLFENSPIAFVTRIQNTGNIHIKPVGAIELRDTFNNLVATIPVNSEKSNVLPSSIRRFESTYTHSWMFGKYTADLIVGYGTKGQALTSQLTFWVIPYKLILVSLIILGVGLIIFVRLLRVYNRYIITKNEKAKKHQKNR